MNNQPKISLLAPAYQAEQFIQRYIDCVLDFDYPNLELILVNDGSKDKTHEIIESNRERITNAGIEFKYINLEENKVYFDSEHSDEVVNLDFVNSFIDFLEENKEDII